MLGWRSMRFRRRASFLWRSVRESARLRSRQRGGSTRPSSRVWPISDFGAVAAEESGELRADGEPVRAGGQRAPAGMSGARPGTGTNKASAKARGVGPLPPRRKVPITGRAQAPRDTYALPIGTQRPSSRKLPVRARKRRQLDRNTRSGPSTNSKNDRACAFDAEKREYSVNH